MLVVGCWLLVVEFCAFASLLCPPYLLSPSSSLGLLAVEKICVHLCKSVAKKIPFPSPRPAPRLLNRFSGLTFRVVRVFRGEKWYLLARFAHWTLKVFAGSGLRFQVWFLVWLS